MGNKPIAAAAMTLLVIACSAVQPRQASSLTPRGPASQQSSVPWHLRVLDLAEAWNITLGEGELIAVVDTGLSDAWLPGLRRREVAPSNLVESGQTTLDTVGHGTAVTSLAAGSGDLGVWGVAPEARVMPIVAGNASVPLAPDAIARGIRLAIGAGASVINLSVGRVSDDPDIRSAIDAAAAAGVIVVAAGGDNAAPGPLFPADIPGEVIAVRALSRRGVPLLNSNRIGVDGVDAPGEDLQAVTVQGTVTVVSGFGGSSGATALVSGTAALLKACTRRMPGSVLTLDRVVRVLRSSAGSGPWINVAKALHTVGC